MLVRTLARDTCKLLMGSAILFANFVRAGLIQRLCAQMLRELDAAMDSRDMDRLEEAIKKGDAWAKRAPINHFMSQVGSSQHCLLHNRSSPGRQNFSPMQVMLPCRCALTV